MRLKKTMNIPVDNEEGVDDDSSALTVGRRAEGRSVVLFVTDGLVVGGRGRGERRSVVLIMTDGLVVGGGLIVTDGLMVGGGGVVVLGNTVCNGRMTTCLKPWWSCWLL